MASYTFATLNDPLQNSTFFGTFPEDINDTGQITGFYYSAPGQSSFQSGFLFSNGVFTTFSVPGAFDTNAAGINDAGQIVGTATFPGQPGQFPTRGFLYSNGVFTVLNDPSASATGATAAQDINNSGEIVGYYTDSNSNQHGFLYIGGNYFPIDDPIATGGTFASAINNVNQIVGSYADNTGDHGFLLSNGTYTTLDVPGGSETTPLRINDSGAIVGNYFSNADNKDHGFLYSGGQFTTFDDPLGVDSQGTGAFGINNAGEIVGHYALDPAGHDGNGYRANIVAPLLPTPTFDAGWTGPIVHDFNGDGFADLAWHHQSDGQVDIQDLSGTGTIGNGVIANNPFGADWNVVASADVNGDGISDLVYRQQSDGLVEIQFLDGNTAVGGGAIANNAFGPAWNIAVSGDFNGDGRSDLVWQRQSDGLFEIQLLNDTAVIGGGAIANNPFGSGWNAVATGDINGDFKSDLVYQRQSDGLVEVQFLSGNVALGGGTIANNAFGPGWTVVAAGDFNGDGISDLVYQRQSDGLVEIQLLGFNAATNSVSAIGGGAIPGNPFASGWTVVGAGDFNGDGHLDLAYRNTATATTEVQFLNGNTNGLAAIGGGIVAIGS